MFISALNFFINLVSQIFNFVFSIKLQDGIYLGGFIFILILLTIVVKVVRILSGSSNIGGN